MTTLWTTAIMKTDIRDSTATSPDLNVAANLERATGRQESGDASIFLTGQVQQTLVGTPWAERLHSVDIGLPSPRLAGIAIYKLQ